MTLKGCKDPMVCPAKPLAFNLQWPSFVAHRRIVTASSAVSTPIKQSQRTLHLELKVCIIMIKQIIIYLIQSCSPLICKLFTHTVRDRYLSLSFTSSLLRNSCKKHSTGFSEKQELTIECSPTAESLIAHYSTVQNVAVSQ